MDKLNNEQEAQGAENANNSTTNQSIAQEEKKTPDIKLLTSGKGKTTKVKSLVKVVTEKEKEAISFATTVKVVQQLHHKVKHLDRLEEYTDELSKFKVKKQEEELDSNIGYYSGCKFEIRDDNNKTFTLKHPLMVKEIIEFVLGRMEIKRDELRAEIKLPTAA